MKLSGITLGILNPVLSVMTFAFRPNLSLRWDSYWELQVLRYKTQANFFLLGEWDEHHPKQLLQSEV